MKKILLTTYMCVCAVMLFSCGKEDGGSESNPAEPTEDARYYVKYEASSGGVYYFLQSVSVNTEKGTRTFTERVKSYSQTFGPVKKGFTASVKVDGASSAKVSIYVCKGEEPFTLKQTGSTSASYVIDF